MKASVDKFCSQQLATLLISLSFLFIILLSILGCSPFPQKKPYSQQAQEAFRTTLNIPIESQLQLLTDKSKYSREDWIGIWVENGTDYAILYPNQDLGLQAYQYNEQDESWHLVDLGSTLGNPRVTIVTPGSRSVLPSSDIPVDNIKASGLIRLVIIGTVEGGQSIATYKDVEIVD